MHVGGGLAEQRLTVSYPPDGGSSQSHCKKKGSLVKNKENWDGKNKGKNSIKDLQGVFLVKTSLMMISDRNRKVLFLPGSLL